MFLVDGGPMVLPGPSKQISGQCSNLRNVLVLSSTMPDSVDESEFHRFRCFLLALYFTAFFGLTDHCWVHTLRDNESNTFNKYALNMWLQSIGFP
jgi:hypothetical protein